MTAGDLEAPRVLLASRAAATAALGLSVAGLVGLVDGVGERGDLAAYDPMVTADAVAERSSALTPVAQAATFVGSAAVVSVLALALVGVVALRWRSWRLAALLAGSMGLAATVTVLLKHGVGRLRPPAAVVLGTVDTGFAFPSGHTLNSTVVFGLIAGLALSRARRLAARAVIVGSWLAASGAVGLSRIYLGYHWMTDVLAGFLAGVAVLSVAVLVAASLSGHLRAPRSEGGATASVTARGR